MKKSSQTRKATRMLSCVGFVLCLMAWAVSSKAQDPLHKTISLDADKQPLEKVLKQIASTAKVKFAYDVTEVKQYKITLREKTEVTIEELLQKLLKETELTFESHGNTIVIYSKDQGASLVPGATTFSSKKKMDIAKEEGASSVSGAATTLSKGKMPVTFFTAYDAVREKISGTILDDNGPLQNASVYIKGTSSGTLTDSRGRFTLEAENKSAVLLITMVGYQTRQITVTAGGNNVIRMERNDQQLDKVVVVAYGSQKRSTISGAVSEVKLDKLSSRSLNNVAEALQGKAPGVIVTNEGGDPTAAPRVNIRGMGGINGEGPLYVVDGSIYSNFPVNPNEIESISVLKDAAAAIYGARASGGVIIITTKKGKSGAATVNVDAKAGVQSAWRKLQSLNARQYADVMNMAADNAGQPRLDAFNTSIYPDGQITRTNWIDDVFRKGKVQDYNIGVSGGTEKSKYFLSYGYRNGEGIVLNTNAKRYNYRLNTEFQLNSWLKIGENMQYVFTDGTGANTGSPYTGALLAALFYPPSVAPYNSDGSFAGLPAKYAGAYGDVINPVAYLKRLDQRNPTNNFFINPYLELKLTKDLNFRSNLAVTKSNSNYKEFVSRVLEIGKIFDYNQLTQNNNAFTELLAEQTLNYTKKLGNHNINVLGGYSYQSREDTYLNSMAQDFDDERSSLRYMQNANKIFPSQSGKNSWALVSYLGRVNYDYNGKYLLSLIGRRDGTSLVAQKNQFANYGSVSAGWLVSKEDFLSHFSWLNNLKIRGSYGVLGNLASLPINASVVPLAPVTAYMGQVQTQVYGYAEDGISNPDLTWAKSIQSNIGVDMSVLNNRITLTADYFVKRTKDMVFQPAPPSTAGVNNGQFLNGGEARDKGIELGLTYNSAGNSAFQYSFSATLTKIANKLVSLAGGLDNINTSGSNIRSTLAPLYIHTGYALYSYYVVKTAGLFKTQSEVDNYTNKDGNKIQPNAKPGDLKFVDASGDGQITPNDRVVAGNPYPALTYGLSFNASYKNFDLNIFAQGVQGNKLFNGLRYLTWQASVSGQNYNMSNEILNAWTPSNPNSSIPRVSLSDPNGNFSTTSDWFIESGSYLRIKNVTLGYTLPNTIARQIHLNSLRLYVTANNLLTFTKYKGFDPEVGMDEQGIDKGRYPQARSLFVGLNVNF
ncbi:SusC/RagA family TonB-linked outer membrane protein [Flavitalea flava]